MQPEPQSHSETLTMCPDNLAPGAVARMFSLALLIQLTPKT